jgi:predicted metallo-beta-lactamase superfamily hydrolase
MSLFCYMTKTHRGEIVANAIKLSGKPMAQVARDIKRSRTNIYAQLDRADMDVDIILAIGKSIHYDFKKHFPEVFKNVVEEPTEKYENQSTLLKKCLEEKNLFKEKYYDIMEAHNKLLEEHNRLLMDKLNGKV